MREVGEYKTSYEADQAILHDPPRTGRDSDCCSRFMPISSSRSSQ